MSRPWILGIVCCLLFASSAAIGWGQEYLDLPEEPEYATKSTSLTDRLWSLKDKFGRKSNSAQTQSAASGRQRPTTPRYRNTVQDRLRAQQMARRAVEQNKAAQSVNSSTTPRVASAPRRSPAPSTAASSKSEVAARPKTADLLPDSQLFSRSRGAMPSVVAGDSKQFTKATDVPRAGSITSKVSESASVVRSSPSTSRANELNAALADLLASKPATSTPSSPAPALKPSALKSQQSTAPSSAVATFDLRKALLDGKAVSDQQKQLEAAAEKKTADEVAAATDRVATADKVVVTETVEAKLADAIKVAPKAVEVPATTQSSEPVAKATESPAKTPAPTMTAQPAVVVSDSATASPAGSEPATSQPIVINVPPKQAITIATPQPSFKTTPSNAKTVVKDPFENSRNSTYSNAPTENNPMREFQPEFEEPVQQQTFARPDSGVLQTTQQPVLVSRVEGPRSILVGREATYQVKLENTSTNAARDVAAEISVPEWAELIDAMSTSGVVERSTNGVVNGALEWKLSELPARSSQVLRLRLIPRSGRPLQLGVTLSQAPVQSQAVVEVQEPKLELAISGPQEVRFGKPQRYRLTLRNPGTGTTEAVSLRLIPPGGTADSAATQDIGDLQAGEVRDIDLELTAREAGDLLIQADAVADGGLKAETTKKVLCLKPELEVDWRGPDRKYAGTVAAYYFRVANPGTAETDPVEMSVKLPIGTEFISASEGYSINATTGVISWSLAGLEANEEQFMQLRCKIARPGSNDFLVTAQSGDAELKDSKAFQTEVVALADLKLEVSDPQGPLPLGESVVYEIRVRNRGTTGAEHINIVGLFSEGIDPTTVEGAQYTVRDGRVSFHPIKSLPAGREVVLRIHAEASQPGTHTFRTEVVCPKLEIKLAAEETTRFFEEQQNWEQGQTPYMAERETTTSR